MKDDVVISDLLKEDRVFYPSTEFRAKANISDAGIYEIAKAEGTGFWEKYASELHWFEPWRCENAFSADLGKQETTKLDFIHAKTVFSAHLSIWRNNLPLILSVSPRLQA